MLVFASVKQVLANTAKSAMTSSPFLLFDALKVA